MRKYSTYLYKYYLAITVVALVFSSCKKQSILTPNFDVTVAKTTFNVGEPIVFSFTGTADVVTLFSGASGAEYRYKDRITANGKPQMQFTSYRTGASTQTNTLSVLVSRDFTNVYDIDNLQKATWTDITSRATLSTGVDNTPSGVIDLSDQLTPNVPVYIAFRYTAKKDAAVAQPTWAIKNLAVNNIAADGTNIPIAAQAATNGIAWGTLSVLNSANLWNVTTTVLTFTGGAINADDNEDWVISQPIQLDRAPRAVGVSIKTSATTRLTTYTFAGYATAGTYTATFEAINANKWDEKSTVKEFTFTVK
ncbi:DUF5017 domain-containing protein [Mucilaginibacter boryungensis]|uniref:DUF5017 domain-containing protein n=1 Tax=Mucilaginibacter boryungensis TaxID=768480 RepID=A0ABR9XFF3_9SPHI|nr:DUF5017 domain-containing protein [Mucilaginibacter boryungensis]MBE9666117.1 DUF5017 domain-containing protein [Mucilaginibacter boryungensis]